VVISNIRYDATAAMRDSSTTNLPNKINLYILHQTQTTFKFNHEKQTNRKHIARHDKNRYDKEAKNKL